jgi:hypothetical protein
MAAPWGGAYVRSEEACIGKRVRVRESARPWPTLQASVGTIKKRWGDPSYTALDVLLDDGTQQLFWHHELEEIAERAYAGSDAQRTVRAVPSVGEERATR